MGRLVGVLADVLALARLALELRTAYAANRDALKRASARGLGSDPRYPVADSRSVTAAAPGTVPSPPGPAPDPGPMPASGVES